MTHKSRTDTFLAEKVRNYNKIGHKVEVIMKMIGASIMTLAGIGCDYLGFHFLRLEVLLDETGQSTTGVVTQLSVAGDENNNNTYYLTYRYEDNRGHSYTTRSDVEKTLFATYAVGNPVPMVYAANFPAISRVGPAGEWLGPVGILASLGGILLCFGLRMILRQIYRDDRLARLTADLPGSSTGFRTGWERRQNP